MVFTYSDVSHEDVMCETPKDSDDSLYYQVVDDLTGQIIHRAAHRISLGAELFEEMRGSYDGSMERKRPPRFCNKK